MIMSTPVTTRDSSVSQHLCTTEEILQDEAFGAEYV